MRLLFFNPSAELGGAERSLLDVLASLQAHASHLDLHVLTCGPGPLEDDLARLGVTLHRVVMPQRLRSLGDSKLVGGSRAWPHARVALESLRSAAELLAFLRRLRAVVRAVRPDLIHSNALKAHALTSALPAGAPIVWHVRDYVGPRPAISRALRLAARRADLAVAISEDVAADVRRTLPGLDVTVIPNAIDLDVFRPGPGDGAWLDRLAGLSPAGPGVVRVGLVATFGRWKGQDVFVRAAAALACEPHLRFYVVGGPIYCTAGSQFTLEELVSSARALGAERLAFTGFVRDTAPVFRALDIVVHASTRPEPFGRTIAEAMACGRAVIAAPSGGASEVFRDGVEGLGVPPRDPRALAQAIARLAAEPETRLRLAAAAQLAATARFSRARLGPTLLPIYLRLVSPPPVGSSGAASNASSTNPLR